MDPRSAAAGERGGEEKKKNKPHLYKTLCEKNIFILVMDLFAHV